MKTYYKYTKYFSANFFKKPTIRISNPIYLNDPFESEAGNNLTRVVECSYNQLDETRRKSRAEIKDALNLMLRSNGIFSVSETPRNALMWAHYADEHSGLCIGFDDKVFQKSTTMKNHRVLINTLTPQKVNYDNYRFDSQTSIRTKNDMLEAIKTHLLTKSDDWIYEKEHRWIIPFNLATSFKVDFKHKNQSSSIMEAMTAERLINEALKIKEIDKISDNEFKFNKNTSEAVVAGIATFECMMFLYEVDPACIKSIYMGIRFSDKDTLDLYSTINDSKLNLSHINLFKFRLSESRFELIPDQVNESYISKLIAKKITP
ncbi:DUF2971 domain-containing protein [Aeromonas veronii]